MLRLVGEKGVGWLLCWELSEKVHRPLVLGAGGGGGEGGRGGEGGIYVCYVGY